MEGRSGVSALDCYSPAPATRVRPRTSQRLPYAARVLSLGRRLRWTACSALRLLPVVGAVFLYDALWTLAVIWVHPTRTKESNMCASLWVNETPRCNEREGGLVLPR